MKSWIASVAISPLELQLGVGQHSPNIVCILLAHGNLLRQTGLAVGGLMLEQMVFVGLATHKFSRTASFKSLCRRSAGLKLGHDVARIQQILDFSL